jgi:hypothetical protein
MLVPDIHNFLNHASKIGIALWKGPFSLLIIIRAQSAPFRKQENSSQELYMFSAVEKKFWRTLQAITIHIKTSQVSVASSAKKSNSWSYIGISVGFIYTCVCVCVVTKFCLRQLYICSNKHPTDYLGTNSSSSPVF